MMFVGYANNHARDVYRMLNPSTGRITQPRDVTWLNCMFFVTPVIATNKAIPKVTLPFIAEKSDKHSDEDSYGVYFPEERREEVNSSSQNSDDDDDDASNAGSEDSKNSNDKETLVQHVTRYGRLTVRLA